MTALQELRTWLMEGLRTQLEAERPEYVRALRQLPLSADPASFYSKLQEIRHQHCGGPVEPWSKILTLLADYELKLDAIRWSMEAIKTSSDGRTLHHQMTSLFVPSLAAVEALGELVKILRRTRLISDQCARDQMKRVNGLSSNDSLQQGRNQVAHPASHVPDQSWVGALARDGSWDAAAVLSPELGESFFDFGGTSTESIDLRRQTAAHVFKVIRTIGGDILHRLLECAKEHRAI